MKIAFDVDDCLINDQDWPKYKTIDLMRWFDRNAKAGDDLEIIVWSGGGIDYAQHFVDKFGLGYMVNRVIEKGSEEVDIAVDDQEIPPEGVKARVVIKV